MNPQFQPKQQFKATDVADAIENELAIFAVNLIKRKPATQREPSRFNLYIVGVAAFLMLTILDLISGVMIGSLTNALYGILVFVIGVGSLAIDEAGYFWAYSSKWQKVIAGFDAFVSITSTLLVGMVAAGLYAVKAFEIMDIGGWKSAIEIGTMVSLVLIGVTHAILWIGFILIDEGVKVWQNFVQGKAKNKNDRQTISLAEENMVASLDMARRLLGHVSANKGGLLGQEIKNLTGVDPLQDAQMVIATNTNGHKPERPI